MMAKNSLQYHTMLVICFLLATLPATQSSALVSNELYPVRLGQKERLLLESWACRDQFNLGMDKLVALGNARFKPDSIHAEVLCQTHDNFKFNAIHHVVFCEKHSAIWKCPRSELAIRMRDNSHSLIYFEDDIGIETAYNIVMKLAASKYYQGEEVPKPDQSTCNIRHHYNNDHALVPDVYVASCELQEVFISTWCPQQDCPRIIGKEGVN